MKLSTLLRPPSADERVAELEAKVAKLEADNRKLQGDNKHLDGWCRRWAQKAYHWQQSFDMTELGRQQDKVQIQELKDQLRVLRNIHGTQPEPAPPREPVHQPVPDDGPEPATAISVPVIGHRDSSHPDDQPTIPAARAVVAVPASRTFVVGPLGDDLTPGCVQPVGLSDDRRVAWTGADPEPDDEPEPACEDDPEETQAMAVADVNAKAALSERLAARKDQPEADTQKLPKIAEEANAS